MRNGEKRVSFSVGKAAGRSGRESSAQGLRNDITVCRSRAVRATDLLTKCQTASYITYSIVSVWAVWTRLPEVDSSNCIYNYIVFQVYSLLLAGLALQLSIGRTHSVITADTYV